MYVKTKLLIAGGNGSGTLSNAEVVNLAGDGKVCSAPADLPFQIEEMASLLTAQGEPLSCGGYMGATGEKTDACFRYVAGNDEWVTYEASLIDPRRGIISVEVSPNKYWILGEFGSGSTTTEIYEDGQFTQGPDVPEAVSFPCAVRITDDLTFLGGTDTTNAYVFDWRSMEFTLYPDVLTNPARGSICGLTTDPGGAQSIVIGGGGVYRFWTEIIDLQTMTTRRGPVVPDVGYGDSVPFRNTFLVVGGGENDRRNTILEFDVVNEVFVERPEHLAMGRLDAYVAFVDDSQVVCN